jgi:sugar-specific transcriptional regulator TrmB
MNAKIDKSLYQELVKVGLTKQESDIYLILHQEGSLSAKEISKRLHVLPNGLYRTAKKLQEKKLITVINKSPLTYQVVPPVLGFPLYAKEKTLIIQQSADQLSQLLDKAPKNNSATRIEVITGKYETYMAGADMVNTAKKEFLVISIGEEIPDELLLAISKAHERGVILRLIVHKYDETNREILDNFKKNGYEIRYFRDWGFHLTVSDGEQALLIVNNPNESAQRVGMRIYSKGLSKALRDYFYYVWNNAQKV